MDNICVECRKSADCKRKPRTDQWTVAGCSWFEADTVITNADRIRSMSDEELAVWISALYTKQYHVRGDPDFWLEWLRQEGD